MFKNLIVMALLASFSSVGTAAQHSCKKFAEVVAVNRLNEDLAKERAPKKVRAEDKATLAQTDFLDANGEIVSKETDTYGVVMTVNEECMDGLSVKTKVVESSKGLSCKVVEIKQYMDRDCG